MSRELLARDGAFLLGPGDLPESPVCSGVAFAERFGELTIS